MNSQNILRFYGSKLDIKLDSSEFYDFEIDKLGVDYDLSLLDLDTPIVYDSLVVDEDLDHDSSCSRSTIKIVEYNNTVNDDSYIYSAITFTLTYDDFVDRFGTGYTYTILNNDIYTYTGITGETHYFKIYGYDNNLSIDSRLSGYTESEIISQFSTNVIDCLEQLGNTTDCCPVPQKMKNKPWAIKFDNGAGSDYCTEYIDRREEKGWTLDFIFNRNSLEWSSGGVFYYLGVRGENDAANYSDNNLSFQFTSDRRIKWVSHHYSGVCDSTSGYTESYYIASGQTPQLCTTGATKDFNVTIVFDRYKRYTDCNLENDGGWNDLIPNLITSEYSDTVVTAVTSTQIAEYNTSELLNKKWASEKQRRLGDLKIYLNGNLIYKLKDWEEIIPSDRGTQPFIQSWGGGTGLMGGIHSGNCCFIIKSVKYYEEPLDFLHVKHNFITRLNDYDFFICGVDCDEQSHSLLVTPTPTITPTITPTQGLTVTPTHTLTRTPTPTPTHTQTLTPSITPTHTVTNSVTPTHTVTKTPTPTHTVTVTPTPTITQTKTPTPTPTPSSI